MIRITPKYRVVSTTQDILGEGPVWDIRSGEFLWVDAYRCGFYSIRVDESGSFGRLVFHHTGFFTIGITPWGDEPRHYLVVGCDGLYEWAQGKSRRITDAPFKSLFSDRTAAVTVETHRFNDVIAGPSGEYYAGIMSWAPSLDANGDGALVVFHRRDHAEVILPGLSRAPSLPNGMGFSPDRRWFYFTDSLRQTIFRLPYHDEVLDRKDEYYSRVGPPEPLIVSIDRPGVPDGMTVASDGSIFSARWGGSCIDHYDANGKFLAEYVVPMQQPSSVAFGGPDLKILLVTSATTGIAQENILSVDGNTIAIAVNRTGISEYDISDQF